MNKPRNPDEHDEKSRLAAARQLLRQARLRATAPRLSVLRKLLETARPLSHSDLSKELDSQGFDRVTVFRNLQDLAEAGILSRLDVGDHTWRFELHPTGDSRLAPHSHFVCDRCKSVSCLSDRDIRVSPRTRRSESMIGRVSAMVLRGRCSHCYSSPSGQSPL